MWMSVGGQWRWLPWLPPTPPLRQVAEGSRLMESKVEECSVGSKLRRAGLRVNLVHSWGSVQVWRRVLKPRKSH